MTKLLIFSFLVKPSTHSISNQVTKHLVFLFLVTSCGFCVPFSMTKTKSLLVLVNISYGRQVDYLNYIISTDHQGRNCFLWKLISIFTSSLHSIRNKKFPEMKRITTLVNNIAALDIRYYRVYSRITRHAAASRSMFHAAFAGDVDGRQTASLPVCGRQYFA